MLAPCLLEPAGIALHRGHGRLEERGVDRIRASENEHADGSSEHHDRRQPDNDPTQH